MKEVDWLVSAGIGLICAWAGIEYKDYSTGLIFTAFICFVFAVVLYRRRRLIKVQKDKKSQRSGRTIFASFENSDDNIIEGFDLPPVDTVAEMKNSRRNRITNIRGERSRGSEDRGEE